MSGKRKREGKDYRAIKKTKSSTQDIVSSLIPNNHDSSDSDSDSDGGGPGTFPAFDLPNYDAFSEEEKEEESKAPVSGKKSKDSGDIIFLSDPSQLPKPLSFTTPTVMQPLVLGQQQPAAQNQVVVMSAPAAAGKGQVAHVRPVLLNTQSQVQNVQKRTASNVQRNTRGNVQNSGNNKLFSTMTRAVQPAIVTNQAGGKNITKASATVPAAVPVRGRSSSGQPKVAANMLASAASSAVAAGMSATSIMQQVALAAQQAAKGVAGRPMAMSTPNKNVRPIQTNIARPMFSPITANGGGASINGVRNNGIIQRNTTQRLSFPNQQPQRRPQMGGNGINGTSPYAQASKWKPYSTTLAKVARNAARKGSNTPAPNTQLNLKQMYSMLRLKFSTKQIYDMCLWDMEHSEASLMEIAINNAFTN